MENLTYQNFLARGLCADKNSEKPEFRYCSSCVRMPTHDCAHSETELAAYSTEDPFVEVRFKNNRKEIYKNCSGIDLKTNDIVAVEASPGHDIGIITLTGISALKQIKRKKINIQDAEMKKVYRKAKQTDIEKWYATIEKEGPTTKRVKKIIEQLKLDMKLNDVEYQGDGTKATFYYTADDRVDFRELIKILADEFKVRVEMRQIGARQEAAKLGGVGACGHELCCSSYMHFYQSVSTNAARTQQLSLNPQKLAGQCSKLKCCLNYELPVYQDMLAGMPPNITLQSQKGDAYHQKTDIFKKIMFYSYAGNRNVQFGIPVDKVKEIIEMNKKKIFPAGLEEFAVASVNDVEDNSYGKEDISKLAD